MRRIALALGTCIVFAACEAEPPPPLTLVVEPATLPADGLARATVSAQLGFRTEGVVVQFLTSGGALGASAARVDDDGRASVELASDPEAALGLATSRDVTLRALVEISADERYEATASVRMVAPGDGPPLVFLVAEPPAAFADGASEIALVAYTRRIDAGRTIAFASSAGTVDGVVDIDDEGIARARLTAPDTPADATVTASDEESGASSSIVVRFVAPGTPQFDLSGTFVQVGSGRVRLRSASLVPDPQCVLAPSLVRVDVEQAGLDGTATFTTCDVSLPDVNTLVGRVSSRAPASFIDAIPAVTETFTIADPALGAEWAPPASVVVAGAALDDPESDALPTESDDPRVRDDDGDGNPGVTVENSLGGDQFIVFRNRGSAHGRIASSVRIVGDTQGDLLAVTETSVFGIGGGFVPEREALPSVVELVRIDGRYGAPDLDADGDGERSCEEVRAAASALALLVVPDTPFDCAGIP